MPVDGIEKRAVAPLHDRVGIVIIVAEKRGLVFKLPPEGLIVLTVFGKGIEQHPMVTARSPNTCFLMAARLSVTVPQHWM